MSFCDIMYCFVSSFIFFFFLIASEHKIIFVTLKIQTGRIFSQFSISSFMPETRNRKKAAAAKNSQQTASADDPKTRAAKAAAATGGPSSAASRLVEVFLDLDSNLCFLPNLFQLPRQRHPSKTTR